MTNNCNEQITKGGVTIRHCDQTLPYQDAIKPLLAKLDEYRGALYASSFEFPERYTCWDIGFYNPPLMITVRGVTIYFDALNERGERLVQMVKPLLESLDMAEMIDSAKTGCALQITPSHAVFNEEERSHQPSVFSILRTLIDYFKLDESYLGLYGAFGYDLIFQFEKLKKHQSRAKNQREMVLYFPDEIYVVNHRKEQAFIRQYEFSLEKIHTKGLPREGQKQPYNASKTPQHACDHKAGEYANIVNIAKEHFIRGDLFEAVPSQSFFRTYTKNPSHIFSELQATNPSPYGFFINLGQSEFLIGASPEMYVRVTGQRVETCPISGTIARGENALEDAAQILKLLNSEKECSELTMCTDVDRNDKSRVCEAGSVQVIGRRQIEMYSRLIHTVDHVEGYLRPGFDAIDAFLTHMWVVTVTGAPKIWAMNFIEMHEKSPRKWYGGAVGWFNFNGNLNTGLVLRTIQLDSGIAEVRAGATVLYDSIPEAEEQETRLKASALLKLLDASPQKTKVKTVSPRPFALGKKVLLVDHQDSFVHTLANYFRQTGAEVTTIRFELARSYLQKIDYDLVVLSPGPGCPEQFALRETINQVLQRQIPLFGVCLGHQGIIEYFGGQLSTLEYPMHGKPSDIKAEQTSPLFVDLPSTMTVGRYHSLYAKKCDIPNDLVVTASVDNDIVMSVSHKTLPIYGVQFHPETIMSTSKQAGMRMIRNLMGMV